MSNFSTNQTRKNVPISPDPFAKKLSTAKLKSDGTTSASTTPSRRVDTDLQHKRNNSDDQNLISEEDKVVGGESTLYERQVFPSLTGNEINVSVKTNVVLNSGVHHRESFNSNKTRTALYTPFTLLPKAFAI